MNKPITGHVSQKLRAIPRIIAVALLVVALFSVFLTRVYVSNTRVYAASSSNLNFQARVANANGSSVPDGNYHIEFKLYSGGTQGGAAGTGQANAGTLLWTETRTTGNLVRVVNGYFSVNLGDVTAFPGTIDFSQELWLTMNVGGTGGAASFDGEMLATGNKRTKLTAVPYAFQAAKAQTLEQKQASFTGTVDFATLTADRKFLFPDTSLATTASPGTICVYNGANSNCPAASGSAFYIQNDTVLQVSSNFNIQARSSTTNGTIGGVIRGAAGGQTVDLFQAQASDGTPLFVVSATGGATVSGLLTANGGLTVETGDNFIINGDTLTDLTGSGLINTTGALTVDATSATGFFRNGGNSFGANATLGTNDTFSLGFRTNNAVQLTVTSTGDLQFAQGANRTLNVAANITANGAGYNFNIAAGAADGTVAGNVGGVLALFGGAAAGSGNNNGGNITLDGGTATGTGTKGSIALQVTGGSVGIGTATPSNKLHVIDGGSDIARFGSSGPTAGIVLTNNAPGNSIRLQAVTNIDATNSDFAVLAGGTEKLRVLSGGNVGIGTSVAAEKLTVAGNILLPEGANRTFYVGAQSTNTAGNSLAISGGAAGAGAAAFSGGALSLTGGAAAGTGNANGGNLTLDGGAAVGTGTKGSLVLQGLGGTVGIGTAAPAYTFDVNGSARIYDQTAGTGVTTFYIQGGANQLTSDLIQNKNNAGTILSGFTGSGMPFIVSGIYRATIQSAALSSSQTYTLPNSSGQFCLDSGNCNGAGSSLQTSYNNSIGGTTAEIKVDSTRGAVDIQDADTTIGANIFNVRAASGSGLGNALFSIGNTGTLSAKTSAGTTLLTADASTLAISINNTLQTTATATTSTASNNLTLITGNATGATSASGDLRLDVGTATGTAGVIKIGDSNTSGIILGRNGLGVTIPSASSLTLGTASSQRGAVLFKNNTNGNTLTLQSGTTASNVTLTLPTADGASGDCLTTNGTGALSFGSCTSGIGALAANTSLSNLANVAVNLSLVPGTLQVGVIDLGSTTAPWRYSYLAGDSLTPGTMNFKLTGTATTTRTITFPDASGTVCLTTGNCSGTGATLQSTYTASTGGTTPEIRLDTTRGAVDIQDADATIGSTTALFSVRASATATTLGNSLFTVNGSGQAGFNLGAATTATADITFGEHASVARKVNVLTRTTNAAGTGLTIQAGHAGTGGTAVAGGALLLQGGNGAGTTGNSNGGDVTIYGGTKVNSGSDGNIILAYNGSAIGRVGIGTNAPVAQLHVAGGAESARFQGLGTTGVASQAYATFYDSNGSTRIGLIGDFSVSDSDLYVQADSTRSLKLGGGGVTMFTLVAGGNAVLGSSTTDTTQQNLQLDSYSTNADSGSCTTTTNQGALYYNTSSHSIRSCTDGSWTDVVASKDIGLFLFGVVPDSGANPGDLPALVTPAVSGPCKVSWATSSTVSVQTCVAYSGGRRVKVSAQTVTITTTTAAPWQHLCVNSDGTLNLTTAAATALLNQPAFSVTAPIVCLADIRNTSNTNTTINAIFDTRAFTTSIKEVSTASTASELGMLVDTSGGNVVPATSASQKLFGVVVATNGSTSTTSPNVIITVVGPAWSKATAGTAGQFIIAGATAGYAITTAAIPNNTYYYSAGNARSAYTSGVTTVACTAATNCSGALYSNMIVR